MSFTKREEYLVRSLRNMVQKLKNVLYHYEHHKESDLHRAVFDIASEQSWELYHKDVKNFERTGELPTCLKCIEKTKVIVRLENEVTKFRELSEDLGKAVNGRPLTKEEVADFENQMWDLKVILDPIRNRLETLGKTQ
ncbi:hypothetical protein CMI37_17025 [Candidatus Pacearchaeota archaeon]|nr:hypothetical protein [Candidatus Pacearchaeota archaeon]|tara:strand:- start:5104 stop:5517 length:414 start_codon:yes stop_codon:yes gene_type:complete